MHTTKHAHTVWEGSARDGAGKVTSQSNALQNQKLSFKKRFEDERGTNPEELIAAAHSACFSMALAYALDQSGHTASKLDTDAGVTLESTGNGYKVSSSVLKLNATVPGMDREEFAKIAEKAKTDCPVSKLLDADIKLEWTLN
ncbi:MAG: OsmC family protein [Hyphomicrobium sp.]|nr:OsmC family protein [Hyphomicrobium sp.]